MSKKKNKTGEGLDVLVEQATVSMALLEDGMKRNNVPRHERRQIHRAIIKAVTHGTDGSASETA